MSVNRQDIENVAQLARLHMDEKQAAEVTSSLNNILALIDQMQAVNTDGVEPLAHASEASQRLRADIVTETDQRDTLQSIAPSVEKGLYRVPKVIE